MTFSTSAPSGHLYESVLIMLNIRRQKVCYVTDVADNPHNREILARFVRGADSLFIEAVFLDEDREQPNTRLISLRALPGRSRERLP
jgi:ribonuclease BN (tRNA processing enzyme)